MPVARSPLSARKSFWLRGAAASLAVVSTLLTLVAVDLLLRAIEYSPPISQPWHLELPRARVPHEALILVNPSLLKEDHYATSPGMETIVTLGDSFTEGYPVRSSNAYPAVMERLLEARKCRTRVINAGIGATGPDQHLRLLSEVVLPRVKPDVVVWQLYENDILDNVRQAVYGIERGALEPWTARGHWMYQRRVFYDALPLPASIKVGSPLLRLWFRALEALGDPRVPKDPRTQREWSARKIRLEIAELERLAAERGFETYYVLLSSQGRYLAALDRTGDESVWREENRASHRELEAILGGRPDVISAWFVDEATWPREVAETLVRTPAGIGIDLFADVDVDPAPVGSRHFNESGYALLAHAVAERLLEDGSSSLRCPVPSGLGKREDSGAS